MSALAIDTNAYAAFFLGDATAVRAINEADEVHVPLIVLAELLAGFAGGSRAEHNHARLDHFLASQRAVVMNPEEKTARHYATIFSELRARGRPMPTNDVWIAALVRQHRVPLLTFDVHFSWVPGINLVIQS